MTQSGLIAPLEPAPAPPVGSRPWGARVACWAEQLIPRAAGVIFLYAGVMKAWDPTRTHRVFAFDGIPQPMIAPLTTVVWVAEVVLGLLLLIGIAKRRAVIAAILVLFVYSVQLAYLIAAQDPPDCSCAILQAKWASAKQALVLGLVRNAVMAACLEWVRLRMAGRTRAPLASAREEDG